MTTQRKYQIQTKTLFAEAWKTRKETDNRTDGIATVDFWADNRGDYAQLVVAETGEVVYER